MGFPITYIGIAKIQTNFGLIRLRDTLCVPQLKIKLVLVQVIFKDLNCQFNLDGNEFYVRNNIILHGYGKDGLYHIIEQEILYTYGYNR